MVFDRLIATVAILLSSCAVLCDASDGLIEISLKAGVIHAPPFGIITERMRDTTIGGLMVDLLDHFKSFAREEGFDLRVELSKAPVQQYGAAFDLVASDCNTTSNPNPLERCQLYDFILGDYYVNSERYRRADFSPPWLTTTITTIKYLHKEAGQPDFTTLKDAELAEASVCVPEGTYLMHVVMEKFPQANYTECGSFSDCINLLKDGHCVLFADDELLLQYRAKFDSSLQVTREQFNSQFLAWPMSRTNLQDAHKQAINRWMYRAIESALVDELYHQYFKADVCPVGTAGENCELPCHPVHGTAGAAGKCVCASSKWEGDDCSIEVPENKNTLSPTMVIICYSLAGINFLLVAGCATWVTLNRKRSQVKIAQPMFLLMVLLGCVISTSSIFALAQEDDSSTCMAIPWLYSVGFSITFGSLFTRIRRIYILLESALNMRHVTLSAKETLLTILAIFAVDVTILVIWTIIDPLQWHRNVISADVFGEPLESVGYCYADHWKVFAGIIAGMHIVLMAVACYMCYLARSIPDKISNGKYVALAMFSNFQILVLAIPVLIILGGDPQASFFVRSIVIWLNDFVVVTMIFGDLIYKVYYRRDDVPAMRRNSAADLNIEIRKYAASKNFTPSQRTSFFNERHICTTSAPTTIQEEGLGM